jgi:hypothetical protein
MATGTYTFATEQRRKGELLGTAKSVLRNLENRKIPVDGTTRDRVLACVSMRTLKGWLKLSLKVSKASDLFAR